MTLSLDPERKVKAHACYHCGRECRVVTGFVYRDGWPHAVYHATCYPHEGEVWIDATLGTWTDAESNDDHVTFGCRCGPIKGQAEGGCGLVPAASTYDASPRFGQKLDREQALAHPWLGAFWDVVDLILTADPTVVAHVEGSEGE